jgi:hypothetical protein
MRVRTFFSLELLDLENQINSFIGTVTSVSQVFIAPNEAGQYGFIATVLYSMS